MASINVVVPNSINDGTSLPNIQVLIEGLLLEQFDQNGNSLGESFTNNPAWILLDLLRRCQWTLADVDLSSFASAAACCDELITGHDANGNVDRYSPVPMQPSSDEPAERRRTWFAASAIRPGCS